MDKERFELLKSEVDAIQVTLMKDHGPWYTKSSNLISIFALSFSLLTTGLSFYINHLAEVRENRREVRQTIEKASQLPVKNFELMQKYDDQGGIAYLSSLINQESMFHSTYAAELMDRYPDTFDTSEYLAVANALIASNITDNNVSRIFELAIKNAKSSIDYIAASRSFASYLVRIGRSSEARKYFTNALQAWNDFPETNPIVVNSTDVYTYMYWSQSELSVGNHDASREYLIKAKEKLASLPPSSIAEVLSRQLQEVEVFLGKF